MREFAIRQPNFPAKSETDDFYLRVANHLLEEADKTDFGKSLQPGMTRHMALTLIGYYQDIVSDTGLWRSFIEVNRKLYGYKVPFHKTGEDYVDYELNREDIRFLIWYDIAMLDLERRDLYPLDEGLIAMADSLYGILDEYYADAPEPADYNIVRGLELNDPEDQQKIYHLGHWLFNNCWLLTPAFALTLSDIVNDPDVVKDKDGITLTDRLEQAIFENPTGPQALFIREWIYLLLNGILLPEQNQQHSEELHPYYKKFTEATGGKEIAFLPDYKSLNDFFINTLGWTPGEDHLPMMKNERDFVLLVNPDKGMLLAKNVARCLKAEDNPLYDEAYAREHSFELLTVRGLCPSDLLHYIYRHDMLPEAKFPGTENRELVSDNHDFIARCYLQQYYRGD